MLGLLLFLAASGGPAASGPYAAMGTWQSETRGGVVAISPCGASICGRLLSSHGLKKNPGLLDIRNKDASLRNRRLMNAQIFAGFARSASGWDGGTIYNGADGGTYKATITVVDASHLRVKGCVYWILCQTQSWVRVR